MDLIEICNLVAKFGSTMATALSEAGSEYTELVRAEGGRATNAVDLRGAPAKS